MTTTESDSQRVLAVTLSLRIIDGIHKQNMGPAYHVKYLLEWIKHHIGTENNQILPEDLTNEERVRLAHYLKLQGQFSNPENMSAPAPWKKTAYSYDFYRSLWNTRHRNQNYRFLFGDVREVPKNPTFVKSRPINSKNANSVLLPLEMSRHFIFPRDYKSFESKIDKAVWRGACYQPWRKKFMDIAIRSQLIDAANTARRNTNPAHAGTFLSITQQRNYKCIISLEGNDVASNLKWAMYSNSVVIMPRPKFETWFCEDFLVPDMHYLQLDDDYQNLDQLVETALDDVRLSQAIITNQNAHAEQFTDIQRQYGLGGLVMDRYFELSEPN